MAEDKSLQDLFASLRSSSTAARPQSFSPGTSTQHSQNGQQQPFISSQSQTQQQQPGSENLPPFSPVAVGTQLRAQDMFGAQQGRPHSYSPSPSPSPSQPQASAQDRTASLLSLLKFNKDNATQETSSNAAPSPSLIAPQQSTSPSQNIHGRGVSASDLVASFMGKPATSTAQPASSPAPVVEPTPISSANPQDYLLQLLNRSQSSPAARPSQTPQQQNVSSPGLGGISRAAAASPAAASKNGEARNSGANTPIRVFGSAESRETTPFDPTDIGKPPARTEAPKDPIFTYVNPFDQLAASTPRNRSGAATPQKEPQQPSRSGPSTSEANKSKDGRQTLPVRQKSFRSVLTANGNEVLQSVESPTPTPTKDGRSKVEALISIGAPTTDTKTVAQALNNVGEQVSQQVDHALAEADAEQVAEAAKELEQEVDNEMSKVASEVKDELDKKENQGVLEEVYDKKTAEAVKDVLEEATEGKRGGHTSAADDEKSSGNLEDGYSVPVYNFPMKPFTSIELTQDKPTSIQFRDEVITDIARLKKEFDQIDRTLATATGEYIMYAMPKPGGIRVIRQEDGVDRQIFKETKDHVFNVALSTAPRGKNPHDLQSCIATAVSGTVYWTALWHSGDHIESRDIEKHCLVFPPVSAHEDHTSGGQLKTRAKKSNRHPQFFAIGRGKAIQVIFPTHAFSSNLVGAKNVVDTEAYFKDRSLKINTGKAGKDFTFSEDDTVIATLDKAGRLRFWDVRELVDESNNEPSNLAPVDIRTSLLTFSTSAPNEKSWPTSVLFVDKIRAYAKGVAQRYVIVGLKQNHILQLWDLGIGKAIQEVYFPHSKESDAICSVAYHPHSGIIVVGHPTRNSIYFIHLSAPKYNLSGMSQAKYLQKIVDKDSSLPKPEATAIMSGMREISFSSKGQLRSIDLLSMSSESPVLKDEPGLFELYVMHSKGVTCLNIQKSDLGWTEENKIIDARDAEAAGLIKMKELVQPPATIVSENSSVNGDAPRSKDGSKKSAPSAPAKAVDAILRGIAEPSERAASPSKPAQNGSPAPQEKPEKRNKKKKATAAASVVDDNSFVPPPAPIAPPPTQFAPSSYASAAVKSPAPAPVAPSVTEKSSRSSKRRQSPARSLADTESITMGISSDFLDKELRKIEGAVSNEFSKALSKELDTLYNRFNEDKRVLQAQGSAHQEAILRLVSSSLGDNVEKSLKQIVSNSIKEHVVPAINQITASTIQKELPNFISTNVTKSLPGTVKQALTETVHSTMQKPDVLRTLSTEVTTKLSSHVEKQFSSLFETIVLPAFRDLTINAASKMATETEQRVSQQLDRADLQHREDTAKIDQLTQAVRALSETVGSMAEAQSEFQKEVLKLQQNAVAAKGDGLGVDAQDADTLVSRMTLEPEVSPEARELETIKEIMAEGRVEEGTIMWLQSSNQAGIFDNFFVTLDPQYLTQCSVLVALSVAAAVTAAMDNHIQERLQWLEVILSSINPRDPEVQDVAPKIADVLCQRLESKYMELAEFDNTNPVLRLFFPLTRKARDIASLSRA